MKREISITRHLVLIFLCIFAISIVIVFPHFLVTELDTQNQKFLEEISKKNGEYIGFRFQEQSAFMYYYAENVDTSLLDDPKAAIESINDIPLTTGRFKRYGISLPDGTTYTSDGKSVTLANESITECIENGRFTIKRISPEKSIDGDEVFVMQTPLKYNDEIKAVFFTAFTFDQIMSNFQSDAFNKQEIFFIVDYNGNIMVNTSKNAQYQKMDNLFYSLPLNERYQGRRIPNMQEKMKKNESGVILTSTENNMYLYYSPLYFNGWYLFSIVPKDAVNQNRNAALGYVLLMSFFLITVFILFTISVISAERRKKEELDKILYTDSLTGGPSYAKFCIDVKKELAKGVKAAYIVMDIDNFKLVNDFYGYEMGNKTIKHIYSLWQRMLRNDEHVGRITADRFAVYLRYSSEKDLMNRLEKFCENCRIFNVKNMSNYILVPSIGVYYIKGKTTDIQKMQNCAVMAKSIVKGDHDSTISVFSSKIKKDLTAKKIFFDKLEHAIKNNELSVVLQPQYNANNGKICAAEVLVRWEKEDGTEVPPSEFIPMAEEKGIVKDIDRFVFRRACEIQVDLANKGFEPIDITVNVSQQSLYDQTIIETYLKILEETGADISHVHIEITESALFNNNREFLRIIRRLHKAGFKILLDDFGTGYSSLMLLKSMPIDALKLDKSFIDDFEHPRGKDIIECVIEMTKKLGITIVAEGIETAAQYEYIKAQNCDVVQGYHFSYPLKYNQFCDRITDSQ